MAEFSFNGIDASSVQNTTCLVSEESVFFCESSSSGVQIFAYTSMILNKDTTKSIIHVIVSVTVDFHHVYDQTTLEIDVTRPLLLYSSLVVDRTVPGQFVFRVPLQSNDELATNSSYFSIDSGGVVTLKRSLDSLRSDTTLLYITRILIYEMRTGDGLAVIDVVVIRPSLEANIQENSPRRIIGSFEDADMFDIALQGTDESSFQINNKDIEIIKQYDYEAMDSKSIYVTVTFNVSDTVVTTCEIIVMITNEDDVSPSFPQSPVSVTIAQSARPTFVMNLKATDGDSDTLYYALLTGAEGFTIRDGNELWKVSALQPSTVTVMVSDLRNPNDTMEVNVLVESPISQDLNMTFSKEINEESVIGTSVITIMEDDHENFQFLSNDASEYFKLNNFTVIIQGLLILRRLVLNGICLIGKYQESGTN